MAVNMCFGGTKFDFFTHRQISECVNVHQCLNMSTHSPEKVQVVIYCTKDGIYTSCECLDIFDTD